MSDVQQFLGGAFDTYSVEPQQDFAAIPPGKYPVLIEKAEVKETKSHTGHYVEITMAVLDGPFKNRKVFDRINIQNPNAQCVEIGLRCLAALGQAIGLTHIADTSQLVNQVCIAHVKVKDEQNEVRTYSSAQAPQAAANNVVQPAQAAFTQYVAPPVSAPALPTPAPTAQAQQYVAPPASTAGVKPPWAR